MGMRWGAAVLCVGLVALVCGCTCPCMKHNAHTSTMLSGMLDGKTFAGEVGMEGQSPAMQDTLTFKDGYFHSSACDQFHFGNGAYLAVASGDTTTFQAITRNRQGAMIVWKGTVAGDKLDGTMTLYEKDKEPVKRWVKATAGMAEK